VIAYLLYNGCASFVDRQAKEGVSKEIEEIEEESVYKGPET